MRKQTATKLKMKRPSKTATVAKALLAPRVAPDDFGELPTLKRSAIALAAKQGHDLGEWHLSHDPHGRHSFCERCGLPAMVTLDPLPSAPNVYGWALKYTCARGAFALRRAS